MINLYKKDETNFKHNAYVLNESISCDVTEEINSIYELNMEFPLNDSKNISSLIVPQNIIKVPSDDDREPQLFVIRRTKPNIENNIISCYAQAIGISKLENNPVLSVNIENKNRKQAIQQILTNSFNPHKFILGNKDVNSNLNSLSITNYSIITALIGDKDNTIKNIYGGEIIFDNFTIDFVDSRGRDNRISVTYAKNVTGAELTMEDIDLITEIIPLGANNLMLPEKSVRATNFDINNPFTKIIEFSDIAIVEAEYDENGNCTNIDKVVTQEQAFELLRQSCNNKFIIEKVNEVNFNLTLNFIELLDYIDFDGNDYSQIQIKRVAIGDVVNVNIKPLNITLKGRISKLTRDKITGRLKSAEIGYKKDNIATTINKTNTKIQNTNKKVDDTKKELKEDIQKANDNTNDLKVNMEARADSIELSVSNLAKNTAASIDVLEGEIESKVSENEFSSLIEQNATSIVETIHGATDNKTTLDDKGLTITGGGFTFEDGSGNKLIQAITSGGMRLGDVDWDKDKTMDMICLGGSPLSQYFNAYNISQLRYYIDSVLSDHGLIQS